MAAAASPRIRHTLASDYTADAYDGEYRTWYQSGAAYERRHYINGHEEGVQQSWTDEGVLYLNYEVREGRRFGLVNASPCDNVGDRVEKTIPTRHDGVTRRLGPAVLR